MSVNWSRLYEAGRCKAVGVPWNEAEAHAAHVLKIPAKYVRDGVLTLEEYKKINKSEEKPVDKEKLLEEARELGSTATTGATTDVLEKEISSLREKAKEKGVKGAHLYKTKEALEKAIEKKS